MPMLEKLEKIEVFDFCDVLCTRGHENWRKLKHLMAWYPTKAQVARKRVELKRRGGAESGIG